MMRELTLNYKYYNGWYMGKVKEIPRVFGQGKSLKELEDNFHKILYKIFIEMTDSELKSRIQPGLIKRNIKFKFERYFR